MEILDLPVCTTSLSMLYTWVIQKSLQFNAIPLIPDFKSISICYRTIVLLKFRNPRIERREMAITKNIPGEALWIRGCPTEDHQIRSGN